MFRTLRFRRGKPRALAVIFHVLLASLAAGAAFASPQTPQTAPPAAGTEGVVEQNVAMNTLLQFLNRSSESELLKHPGLKREVVDSILANRAAGKSFASIAEFRRMTKIAPLDFEAAFKPFYEADLRKTTLAATRKPIQPVTAPGQASAAPQAPAPAQGSAPEAGPIGAVRAGYYAQLEGYDKWEGVDPAAKREFFETVNRERCTCGCTNETLAWCYVNDKTCPVVRPRVKKIYDDLMKRVAASPPATESSPNPR
jgi:hypothetical protein